MSQSRFRRKKIKPSARKWLFLPIIKAGLRTRRAWGQVLVLGAFFS
jgi:hypothetical protein